MKRELLRGRIAQAATREMSWLNAKTALVSGVATYARKPGKTERDWVSLLKHFRGTTLPRPSRGPLESHGLDASRIFYSTK